jgi:hypothetical protein
MDDLINKLSAVKGVTLAFADDICLLLNSRRAVQECIKIFNNFCSQTGMKINVKKSAILSNKPFSPFHLNNEEIPSPESYNYLGTNWNPHLKTFKTNFIADLHKKAKFKVSEIAKYPVSSLAFIKLINSTVAPIYKYGIEIIPWNLSEIRSMDTYLRKTA